MVLQHKGTFDITVSNNCDTKAAASQVHFSLPSSSCVSGCINNQQVYCAIPCNGFENCASRLMGDGGNFVLQYPCTEVIGSWGILAVQLNVCTPVELNADGDQVLYQIGGGSQLSSVGCGPNNKDKVTWLDPLRCSNGYWLDVDQSFQTTLGPLPSPEVPTTTAAASLSTTVTSTNSTTSSVTSISSTAKPSVSTIVSASKTSSDIPLNMAASRVLAAVTLVFLLAIN
ncbi:UNVERIFIED_CONTAM: hypothetical protein HDU68_010005 [Siphonaria sp. JEL0065]|nr:hypothetical protein HDU68_010005 [Siphonaria sp. JEL0065]